MGIENQATLDKTDVPQRVQALFSEQLRAVHAWTNRMFAGILLAQWLFGIVLALWVTPLTWVGSESFIHPHVWFAVLRGGVLSSIPIGFIFLAPRWLLTRHV